jgi:DNA-binding NarL/FixJ family response regulator
MEQQNQQVQWRRGKVQELCSKGCSQREISQVLQIGLATVNRDISYLRNQAKFNIKKYIDERLPEEYEKCLVGLNAITKEAWNTAQQTEDRREKIQALSLAKECYSMKLDLLTNATVVDDAIRFVSQQSRENLKSSSNEDDREEPNDPVKMPILNGFELCKKIIEIDKTVHIIFITASEEYYEKFRGQCFPELGKINYIQKPIGNDELIRMVNMMVVGNSTTMD